MDIKKRFWIFCFVFFLSSVQIIWSQTYPIDKGSKLLFGGMSVQTSSGKLYEDANKNGSFNLTMNPGFAHFVLHGLAVGMMMELSSSFQGNDKAYGYGVGPHVSYAYGPAGKVATFYPFVEANFLYREQIERFGLGDFLMSSTLKGYKMIFGLGVDYMLTESVGLYLEGLYHMEKLSMKDTDEKYNGNAIQMVVGIVAFIY